jgi:hypothetical protein
MSMETPRHARREAYDMGFNDSLALTTDEIQEMADRPHMADDAGQALSESFSYFTDSARWANSLLPRLRSLAGYDDTTGVGTYTDPAGSPPDALDELVGAYRDGWVDKSLGYERYGSRPHLRETVDGDRVGEGGSA